MKKLILWLVGAAIALLGLLAGAIWLLGAISRPTESYAEQQARLAREQQSADFWQWVVKAGLLLIAIALITFVWQWGANQSHRRKLEEMKTREDLFRLYPDQNGNKPTRFDRQGNTISPRAGNTPYPAQYQFYTGQQPQQLKPGRSASQTSEPIIHVAGQPIQPANYKAFIKEPEQLQAPEQISIVSDQSVERSEGEPNSNFEANERRVDEVRSFENDQERAFFLLEAKRGGAKKQASLAKIGIRKGDNSGWKRWSPYWDELPEPGKVT